MTNKFKNWIIFYIYYAKNYWSYRKIFNFNYCIIQQIKIDKHIVFTYLFTLFILKKL